MSLDDLRRDLACAGDVRFLNYAATAPLLRSSAETMARVAREGTRPMAEHFAAWLGLVESARLGAAEVVGARADEITFTTNTSTALSLIAAAVKWREGERVLYPADEFPSNRFVWDNLRDLGVEAEAIAPEPGRTFADQLARRDLSRVRLVAVSLVSYRDGRVHDVGEIVRLCHAREILVAVDGIQAVGAMPVDARSLGCDFLACGGQKWLLGPVGTGFLYVARERLESLHVPTVGWASSRHAGDHEAPTLAWTDGAARFEAGLPDVAAIAALGTSLDHLRAAGWTRVFGRIAEHRGVLNAGLAERGLPLSCAEEASRGSGIVTFRIPEGSAGPLAETFSSRRVILTSRRDEIRVSAHAPTAGAEIAAFFEALDAALGKRRTVAGSQAAVGRDAAPGSGIAGPAAGTPPSAPLRVRNRWARAVVTGASRGLGAAIAEALAARGCELVLIGRDARALEQVAARIAARHRVAMECFGLDLAEPAALAAWIAEHRAALATTDLLVNNAAWAEAAPFAQSDPLSERAAFETNALAPMALARAVLPGMLERGRGALLNVATTGARNSLPLFSAYAASKAALWAWSEALGRELHGTGVTVTTFVPPHMDTATRRQLGRRAVGYYDVADAGEAEGHRPGQGDRLAVVARDAIEAAAAGRATRLPAGTRWQLALNALAPERVAARIRKSWKGPAH